MSENKKTNKVLLFSGFDFDVTNLKEGKNKIRIGKGFLNIIIKDQKLNLLN